MFRLGQIADQLFYTIETFSVLRTSITRRKGAHHRGFTILTAIDQCSECEKSLLNMLSCFSTRLNKINPFLCTPPIYVSQIHCHLKILFGTQQYKTGCRSTFDSHLVPHILYAFPTFRNRHIEHQHDSLAWFEISANNGSKFFLPRSIPDTQFNFPVLNNDVLGAKVYGGDYLIPRFFVFDISPENRCFSCSCVPHKYNFIPNLTRCVAIPWHSEINYKR